jgi:hypothetical protein
VVADKAVEPTSKTKFVVEVDIKYTAAVPVKSAAAEFAGQIITLGAVKYAEEKVTVTTAADAVGAEPVKTLIVPPNPEPVTLMVGPVPAPTPAVKVAAGTPETILPALSVNCTVFINN